jgi:O-6-methylguanine DNA methyltransferase
MIEISYLARLSGTFGVLHGIYSGPTGEIYILGDDVSLKSLIFAGSLPRSYDVGKHFQKGATPAINAALDFLSSYFDDDTRSPKPGAGKRAVRGVIINSIIRLEHGGTILHIDLSEFTKKEITVYRELLRVPFGSTVSYGALAARAGIPRGARFVGNAMAKNNFPIIIPCHRVINADGTMGNYSGGTHIKKLLLDHERSASLPLDRAGRF